MKGKPDAEQGMLVSDAPLEGALQGQAPLLQLPRAAAGRCSGSAEPLKPSSGFAWLPAADSRSCTSCTSCASDSWFKKSHGGDGPGHTLLQWVNRKR